MNKEIFVDVICLTTVSSGNVNRDQSGLPKTGLFGGVHRARISSQAQKRVVRDQWKHYFEQDQGIRSRYTAEIICEELEPLRPDFDHEECLERAVDALIALKIVRKPENKKEKTEVKKRVREGTEEEEKEQRRMNSALFFISRKQAHAIAEVLAETSYTKDDLKQALREDSSVDIHLFGRMAAGNSDLDVEACCQVANAETVDECRMQEDVFSAREEYRKDKVGAAHLASSYFVSGTFLKYATVNLTELYDRIGPEAVPAVISFVRAFTELMPNGKKSAYTNASVPGFVTVVMRDQPVSPFNAFQVPVKASKDASVEEQAVQRLEQYYTSLYGKWVEHPYSQIYCSNTPFAWGTEVRWLGVQDVLKDVLESLLRQIRRSAGNEKKEN